MWRRKLIRAIHFSCNAFSRLLPLIIGLVIVSCSSGLDLDEPPDIRYGEDSCDRCLMIVNEARYAAAYVTRDGDTRRFDDIGGMLAYRKEVDEEVLVLWVHDFDTEAWLKANEAHYVMSDKLHTPMGFGIIAFAGQEQAESWTAENGGMEMSYSEMLERNEELGEELESDHAHSE